MVDGMSKRHNLNSRSSTEAELIREYLSLPTFLWYKYSIEAQGFEFEESFVHQNLSAMLIDNNGRLSSGDSPELMPDGGF